MRITKKVFLDLAIWMVSFGIFIGIIFPFFTAAFGFEKKLAFSFQYFAACIVAGIVVAVVNFILSKVVVANRLRLLIRKINLVQTKFLNIINGGNLKDCSPQECSIAVDSNDEIGETSNAFNNLVNALFSALSFEKTIQNYTNILSSNLELDNLTEKALDLVIETTKSTAGAIMIEKEGELVVLKSYAIKNAEILNNHPILFKILKNGNFTSIEVPENIVIDSLLVNTKPEQIILQPIIYNNIPIGVLLLSKNQKYSFEELSLINIFSQSLSISLNNAIIHEQIQKLAAIDSLTGLLNRRYGMIRLREEFSRAMRTEGFLAVIMFDIDYFKKINDIYGHIVGDRVLVHVARLVRGLLREGDIMIRYGGEEFCILLPGASNDDAYKMAERIRIAVQESKVKYAEYEIKFTISLGIASYPELDIKDEQELLKAADDALYISKNSGRNRSSIR